MQEAAGDQQVVMISPKELRPHPENEEYFTMNPEVYQELKADIAERGIQQPLVVASDGRTILSGHLRHRAALELGLEKVPVIVKSALDPDTPEAAWWMLLDNFVRRQVSPIAKARAIRKFKERHGIKQGARTDLAGTSDIMSKVAEMHGISPRQVERYDRLNFLASELQRMVEEGALSMVAGVELSYLAHEVQERLAEDWEAALRGITAAGARELRRKLMRASGEISRLTRSIESKEASLAKLKGKVAERVRKELEKLRTEREQRLAGISEVLSGAFSKLEEGEQRKRVQKDQLLRARNLASWLISALKGINLEKEKEREDVAELRQLLRQLRGMLQEMKL